MKIGYARVSTVDQNPELQLDALRKAGCERIYTDKASGITRDRPQLAKALGFVKEGDTLVCWKLDRVARSLSHLLKIAEDLSFRGVGFESVTECINTTTPAGKMMLSFLGAFAEFERSIIRERTIAGVANAHAKGIKSGRRPKFEKAELDLAVHKLNMGLTYREVAASLGCSKQVLYRYIRGTRAKETDNGAFRP
jgi:DNA invertase Pin-like site-specific DNA recombinase